MGDIIYTSKVTNQGDAMPLEDDLKKKAHQLIDDTADAIKQGADTVEQKVDEMKQKKEEGAENLRQHVIDAAEKAKKDVEETRRK